MLSFDQYFYEQIGRQVRKYREQNKLTQEKLSELLGLNDKYIGHIERCERKISVQVLIQIMAFFKIQPDEFFSFDNRFDWKR